MNQRDCLTRLRALACLVALVLVGAGPAIAAAPLSISGVATVSDGDTVKVTAPDGTLTRVRLDGIDAPETAQQCAAAGRLYRCGVRATVYLKSLAEGREVRCVGSKVDRYGRLVARCFVGSTDLGAAMVLAGHALAYRQYSEEYVHLEDAARSGLSGIWAGDFQAPWDWRKARRAGRAR